MPSTLTCSPRHPPKMAETASPRETKTQQSIGFPAIAANLLTLVIRHP